MPKDWKKTWNNGGITMARKGKTVIMTISIPGELLQTVKTLAIKQNRSLSNYVSSVLDVQINSNYDLDENLAKQFSDLCITKGIDINDGINKLISNYIERMEELCNSKK